MLLMGKYQNFCKAHETALQMENLRQLRVTFNMVINDYMKGQTERLFLFYFYIFFTNFL